MSCAVCYMHIICSIAIPNIGKVWVTELDTVNQTLMWRYKVIGLIFDMATETVAPSRPIISDVRKYSLRKFSNFCPIVQDCSIFYVEKCYLWCNDAHTRKIYTIMSNCKLLVCIVISYRRLSVIKLSNVKCKNTFTY